MDPIRYTLSFPAPHTHYVHVRAEVPTSGRDSVELSMAVWTPGSYLVREYSRHVEGVAAESPDGVRCGGEVREEPLADHDRRRAARHRDVPRLRPRDVGANQLDRVRVCVPERRADVPDARRRVVAPHEVTIVPAAGWMRSVTSLDAGPRDHVYCAPDYDTLVDSPILVGNPAVHEFSVDGTPHLLVNEGDTTFFDAARAVRDLEAIVRAHKEFWGTLPYDRYVFINLITEAGGGLEHGRCSVLMTNRWATRTRKAYLNWLELASHELFHVWNVKRLRPIELGPFDYEREVFTTSLWMVEGITDYYGDVLVHRAGLSSSQEFLDSLSDKIEEVQTTPGRAVHSVSLASLDAWIKLYRPDENSPNTTISYYTKGAVVAFLLDAAIRRATNSARSLDDVMRDAYRHYSGERGFTPAEFRALTEDVAGADLGAFWRSAIEGTDELDYTDALEIFGLRFKPIATHPTDRPKAWLGATTRVDSGRLLVSHVRRHTPAFSAGLNVDDEIVAIDEVRVRADRLDERLEQYAPGDQIAILVARRERVLTLPVTLGAEPPKSWRLEPADRT